jgi:outer membrane receptor protein involved in Fe transport
MNQRRAKHGRIHYYLAAGAAVIAFSAGVTGTAWAQAASAQPSVTVKIDIARGDLSKSLTQLGRQAGVQIAFLPGGMRGRRADAIRGNFTVEQALDRLLAGTGLRYQRTSGGSYIIGSIEANTPGSGRNATRDLMASEGLDSNGKASVPEILVLGSRWTLNLDIPRTSDDAQPYIVFTHDQIAKSGATSLDDFFRDRLGVNNTATTSLQNRSSRSQSLVNLRGLGPGATLILVDGRRFAQANDPSGMFTQSSVNGIPIDAIERIEVLASSASGIYGSSAVGGVINIIMRRDYQGIEANAYYGNTTRFDAFDERLSVNGSFPIEKGRTRISFTGSWQKTGTLYSGDRDFVTSGRALALENDPSYFTNIGLLQSTTPNIMSDGGNLVFKPAYGGTALGSNVTFLPHGFRGIAQDGVAALLANAGRQNNEVSPSANTGSGGNGNRTTLLSPAESYSGSVTIRRDFNSWLNAYGELGYSHYENPFVVNQVPATVALPATAVNNPFEQDITVSVPSVGNDFRVNNIMSNKRVLAGAIAKLPYGWQAVVDVNLNWNRFESLGQAPGLNQATIDGLQNGTIDVMRDTLQFPVTLGFLDSSFGEFAPPSTSFARSYSLKLAGPLPIRLPGGRPILTLLAQQDKQTMDDYKFYVNSLHQSSVGYTPKRSQRTDSLYGEARFPIIGKDNHVPLAHELELQLTGRYDRYVGIGAKSTITCFPALGSGQAFLDGPLPAGAAETACPPASDPPTYATTRNDSFNPTVALRWMPTQDLILRASYSTGYQPPALNAVIKEGGAIDGNNTFIPELANTNVTIVNVTDPQRNGEPIGYSFFGVFNLLPVQVGGNPDVAPQTSKSWSMGAVFTPGFVPGLRLSVDWTRIVQKDVYFSPFVLIDGGNIPGGQQAFEDFITAHPERVTRAPLAPGDMNSAGKIIAVDVSTANLAMARSEAIDVAASYTTRLGQGQLSLQANATQMLDLRLQTTKNSDPIVATGVADSFFLSSLGSQGGVKFKANGSLVYSTDKWSLGWRARYFSGYWMNFQHTIVPLQGSARISGQMYNDIYGSYRIFKNTEIRAGVNNVLDHKPPTVATSSSFYSGFGDPRLSNFYVSIHQKF